MYLIQEEEGRRNFCLLEAGHLPGAETLWEEAGKEREGLHHVCLPPPLACIPASLCWLLLLFTGSACCLGMPSYAMCSMPGLLLCAVCHCHPT